VLARVGIALCIGASVLAADALARAQEAAPVAAAPVSRTVEIVVVGSESDSEALRAALGTNAFDGATLRWSRKASLEADELFERPPDASDVEVRVWIDLHDSKQASLYFADRAGERFLVRTVALPDGLSPLAREALGQVLELSVKALLEDDRVGMSRAETSALLNVGRNEEPAKQAPPPDVPEPSEPPATADESSLGAEIFYGARLHSKDVSFVHGPGLGLGWITESYSRYSIFWITAQYELPEELVTPEVGVEWTTLRVQGGIGLEFAAGTSFFAGGRLGAGVDVTSFSPRPGSESDAVTLEPSSVSTAPVVSFAFEGSVALSSRLAASARLFASFYPVRVHYDLEVGGETTTVLAPYWVRPGLEFSLQLR
jgi:hypothetical protein